MSDILTTLEENEYTNTPVDELANLAKKLQKKEKKLAKAKSGKKKSKKRKEKIKKLKRQIKDMQFRIDILASMANSRHQTGRWDKLLEKSVPTAIDLVGKIIERSKSGKER